MAYLRRTQTVEELKTLAAATWDEATDTVTLTTNSYEGGSASGTLTFEKATLGLAIERLIGELDPTEVKPQKAQRSIAVWTQWSGSRSRG